MDQNHITFLELLQLSDSALPVGTAAHSFGLETLAAEGSLTVEQLEAFLRDYLEEAGVLECQFCLRGYRLADLILDQERLLSQWIDLNRSLSAFKTARESRTASLTLGRRLLRLSQVLEFYPPEIITSAKGAEAGAHYCIAFGLICGMLEVDKRLVGLAFLQQMLTGLISACQRLMPLGQSRASKILWSLKPVLYSTLQRSEEAASNEDAFNFTPLVELGSMRHPTLMTRLFIS